MKVFNHSLKNKSISYLPSKQTIGQFIYEYMRNGMDDFCVSVTGVCCGGRPRFRVHYIRSDLFISHFIALQLVLIDIKVYIAKKDYLTKS